MFPVLQPSTTIHIQISSRTKATTIPSRPSNRSNLGDRLQWITTIPFPRIPKKVVEALRSRHSSNSSSWHSIIHSVRALKALMRMESAATTLPLQTYLLIITYLAVRSAWVRGSRQVRKCRTLKAVSSLMKEDLNPISKRMLLAKVVSISRKSTTSTIRTRRTLSQDFPYLRIQWKQMLLRGQQKR